MCRRIANIYRVLRPEQWLGVAVVLFACFFIALFFHSNGFVPAGGDWAYPATHAQAEQLRKATISSWSGAFVNPLGTYQINLFPDALFSALLPWVGLPYILVGGIAFVYFSFLALAREIGVETPLAAFIGFALFIFSAIFFDYFVMGWLYALIATSMLPLAVWAYLRALRGSNRHILLAGLLFALSPVQSQAVIWFLIVFTFLSLASLLRGDGWRRNVWVLGAVVAIFMIGNAYWLPMLLFYPPANVSGGHLASTASSIGTFGNFSLVNSLHVWGGLYNFQFETIMRNKGLEWASYMAPLLAVIGLIGHRSRFKLEFSLLLIFPLIIELLGMHRQLIALIPFGNVFRDVTRFLVVSLFGTSVLVTMGANVILGGPDSRWRTWKFVAIVALVILGCYPWWSGAMWDWQASTNRDIRLRIKEYPASWYRLEKRLGQEALNYKALYYPVGGTISFRNDPRFRGAYNETGDIFANLSPIPGVFNINDRSFGVLDGLRSALAHAVPDRDQLRLLSDLGVRLFIFRHHLNSPYPVPSKTLINEMLQTGAWTKWMSAPDLDVYAAKHFNPRIYAIQDSACGTPSPTIEYRRIDSTQYRVRVHGLKCPVTLVLNETFNRRWRLGLVSALPSGTRASSVAISEVGFRRTSADQADLKALKSWISSGRITGIDGVRALKFISRPNRGSIQNDNLPAPTLRELFGSTQVEAPHHVVHQYVNGWDIDPSQAFNKNEDVDLIMEFVPQRIYIIGHYVTLGAVGMLLLYAIFMVLRPGRIEREGR